MSFDEFGRTIPRGLTKPPLLYTHVYLRGVRVAVLGGVTREEVWFLMESYADRVYDPKGFTPHEFRTPARYRYALATDAEREASREKRNTMARGRPVGTIHAACPGCGNTYPLRKDGTLPMHGASPGLRAADKVHCKMSGRPPSALRKSPVRRAIRLHKYSVIEMDGRGALVTKHGTFTHKDRPKAKRIAEKFMGATARANPKGWYRVEREEPLYEDEK